MPRRTIADAALDSLRELRAATSAELAEPITAEGLTRAKSPTRAVSAALNEDARFSRIDDRRWVAPVQLLVDATLTHRATRQELTGDALALEPDLAPLVFAGPARLRLPDGSALVLVWGDDARSRTDTDTDLALQGPRGWLSGFDAVHDEMPLLHARIEDGVLSVTPGPEPPATARMGGRRLIEGLRRQVDERSHETFFDLPPAVDAGRAILALLVDDPELLREPLLPISSLLEGSGLEPHRNWIGYAGTDWRAHDETFDDEDDWLLEDSDPDRDGDEGHDWMSEEDRAILESDDEAVLTEYLAERFGLSEDTVEGLKAVMGAYEMARRGRGLDDPESLASAGDVISDPGVALVLASTAARDAEFEPFVSDIETHSRGTSAAGPRFLLAVCAEARDDLLEAERRLRAAIEADPSFGPAAAELARFELDRGRYSESARLLRAAGAPDDDPELVWLERIVKSAPAKVGRNQPCPCGSGRKYKACHLGREDIGPVDVAGALLRKIWRWLDGPSGRRLAQDLFREAHPDRDPTREDDDERLLLEGQFIDDVLLFDRDQLGRFAALHDGLVPSQELDLARSWADTRRSLYEVRSVRPGRVMVHDLLVDGPNIELADQTLSTMVERLDLLCLRLVPDGRAGLTPATALHVPRPQRERVADILGSGDPLELLRWILEPVLLPKLVNAEGEPLQLAEASYRLPDPAAAEKALAVELERDGEGRFIDLVEIEGRDVMRGSIRIEGDEAHIEANSTRRIERIEWLLEAAVPGARLIRRTERGIEDALEESREGEREIESSGIGPGVPLVDPASEAVLEQFIRDHERRWVDDSIPALDGMTPREARDDPAMRPRLEALLDDMEWQARRAPTGTMNAGRVRALLSLD